MFIGVQDGPLQETASGEQYVEPFTEKMARRGPACAKKQVKTPRRKGRPTRCRFLLKMDSEPYFLAGTVGRKR